MAKLIVSLVFFINFSQTRMLTNFSNSYDISKWEVVTDTVMGGRSSADFNLDASGNAVFKGTISLENNGGFASAQYSFDSMDLSDYSQFKIRLKGDGKPYQFRAKSAASDQHSYIAQFETTGKWQTISIAMNTMEPQFHGEKLKMPNYPAKHLKQITLLFGNKEAENFKLKIDKVWIE